MKLYINADDNQITFNKRDYLLRAAKNLGLKWVKDIKEADEEPEFILNVEPCTFVMGSKWTGFWHIDTVLDNNYASQYGIFDNAFLATDQGLTPMPPNGDVLFQAADTKIHKRYPDIPQDYDFVMCLSMGRPFYGERERVYEMMQKQFTYKDFGKGYPPEEYTKNLNKAKVQFIHTGIGSHGKGNAAQRFWECLAIGPILTNWTDDLPLTGLVEGVDYLAYHDDNEMIYKMKALLSDEDLRSKIAANGRRKSLLYHTYEHRLISIINSINEHLSKST